MSSRLSRPSRSLVRGPSRVAAVLAVLAALAALAVAACIGDDPTVPESSSEATPDGGGPGPDPGDDGGRGGDDGGDECTSATCSDPSTLKKCDGTTETCAFGCDATGGAHCKVVYPSGLVQLSDLATPGATAITLAQSTGFVTDTGEIENLRVANTDPLQLEVKDGIGFRLATGASGDKLAIWTFDSLTIPDGITARFSPTNPAAFVAAKTIAIAGAVDARGYVGVVLCGDDATPGPGGFAGGAVSSPGFGPGGGQVGAAKAGAGGGGHGGEGGEGGPSFGTTGTGGDGGAAYGVATLVPLVGGSGGAGSPQAKGGGGGGAIQIVAVESITIGGGTGLGGVIAAGCQGGIGGFGSTGGGGGSGGSILLETRTLTMLANGRISATGGGGASGGSSTAPKAGGFEGGGAGGTAAGDYGFGGSGASGTPGNNGGGAASAPSGSGAGAGAGGAVGRVRINNRTGSFTPPPNSIFPALGQTTNPAATVGLLDVR